MSILILRLKGGRKGYSGGPRHTGGPGRGRQLPSLFIPQRIVIRRPPHEAGVGNGAMVVNGIRQVQQIVLTFSIENIKMRHMAEVHIHIKILLIGTGRKI